MKGLFNKRTFTISYIIAMFLIVNTVKAAVWTATLTGNWNNPSTWQLVSGSPALSYPSTNDDVTVSGFTVTVNTSGLACNSLTITATGVLNMSSGQSFNVGGNLNNAGKISSTGCTIAFYPRSTPVTFTQAGTLTNSTSFIFNPNGKTINITASSVLSGVTTIRVNPVGTGGTVNNAGNIGVKTLSVGKSGTLNNTGSISVTNSFSVITSGTVANQAAGSLTTRVNIFSDGTGILNASVASNTVTYIGSTWTTILGATYDNLTVTNSGTVTATKILGGNITVNTAFTVSSNVALNCNNKNVSINGTWRDDNGSVSLTNTSGGTFTFGGTSPTFLTKTNAETLGNVVVACTGSFIPNSSNTATYTGNFTCKDLTLQSGTFDFNTTGNYTITTTGNMNNTGGTLSEGNGLIIFGGSVAQTISGNTMTFTNIRSSNAAGVSTTTAQNLSGTLSVTSGTFTSNTADFTLVSDAATSVTGRISALTSGSVGGSLWVVQRRILTTGSSSSTPYWGDYSSPTTSSTLSDWDNEMYLSGCGGADGNACCPIFRSVKQWNNGAANYSVVTSLIPLVPGYGYSIWTASNMSSLSPFTFDTRGTLNSGNITKTTPANQYYLLGNPYPSQILWSSISKTNLQDVFYVLDEVTQNYDTWDGSTSTGTGKLSGTGGVINSSQGFLVRSNGSGSITFAETNKTTGDFPFIRQITPENLLKFHFSNTEKRVGAENMLHFISGANNGVDDLDIGYLKPPFEKTYDVRSLTMQGLPLFKNTLDLNNDKQEVPVLFTPAEGGRYSFVMDGIDDLKEYTCVVLEDVATGRFTDLHVGNSYTFDCDDNSDRRFVIHFSRNKEAISCIKKSQVFAEIDAHLIIASQVYADESQIAISFNGYKEKLTTVSVYNSTGQLVSVTEQLMGQAYSISKPAESGIYLVVISREGRSETHKVFVK